VKRGFSRALHVKIGTLARDVVYVRPLQSIEPGARIEWVERDLGETHPTPTAPIQTGVVDRVNEFEEVFITRA